MVRWIPCTPGGAVDTPATMAGLASPMVDIRDTMSTAAPRNMPPSSRMSSGYG